ncbi:MAG: hypothetical protein M1826_004409 [Phylliscum demangeonii]|nr:MAG: hypothetical protein M1826_004409 [Phylliscum demangeonii]
MPKSFVLVRRRHRSASLKQASRSLSSAAADGAGTGTGTASTTGPFLSSAASASTPLAWPGAIFLSTTSARRPARPAQRSRTTAGTLSARYRMVAATPSSSSSSPNPSLMHHRRAGHYGKRSITVFDHHDTIQSNPIPLRPTLV